MFKNITTISIHMIVREHFVRNSINIYKAMTNSQTEVKYFFPFLKHLLLMISIEMKDRGGLYFSCDLSYMFSQLLSLLNCTISNNNYT